MIYKNVRKVLKEKVKDWIKSVSDKEIQDIISKNCIITGGSIISLLTNEQVNDYDVYFKTKESLKKVAEYYAKEFNESKCKIQVNNKCNNGEVEVKEFEGKITLYAKSSGVASESQETEDYQYFEGIDPQSGVTAEFVYETFKVLRDRKDKRKKYRPIFFTSNSITLSEDVQIVTRFYGSPEEIHKNYDFSHCTNYYDFETNELVLNQKALTSLVTKQLYYQGSLYPLASVLRLRKFIKRGWIISAGDVLKICMQINKLDLTNPMVLKDQLMGVDVAYFYELLEKLKNAPELVDYTYIMNLIDELCDEETGE